MRNFWRRRGGEFDLEHELRATRPEPKPEFLRTLAAQVRPTAAAGGRGLRVALVGALTAAMLVALASVGGLGYAASAVNQAIKSAERIAVPRHHARPVAPIVHQTPASDQYGAPKTVTICFKGHTVKVISSQVPSFLARGAKLSKCGPKLPGKVHGVHGVLRSGGKPKNAG